LYEEFRTVWRPHFAETPKVTVGLKKDFRRRREDRVKPMRRGDLETIGRWLILAKLRERPAPAESTGVDFTASGDLALDNVVANLLLEPVENRMARWGSYAREGDVLRERRRKQVNPPSGLPIPKNLFTIHRPDSGSGMSWSEAYFVTSVPALDVKIVTVSVDSAEMYGYADLAIGFCGLSKEPLWGIKKIIVDWWKRAGGVEPTPWENLLGAGLVSKTRAFQWREERWGARSRHRQPL
jgi:hypothetical protein